jgi:hypothetical protein
MTALRRIDDAFDVQPQTTTRLLDWLEPIHDPGGVISRAVLRLDQLAAKRGVRLYPQTDFRALKAVVEGNRAQGTKLMPHVDVDYSTVGARNAFWIYGTDADGQTATTQAGRFYDFTGTTLAAEMASFRFFYDEPARHITEDCFVRMPLEASLITGPASHAGTLWVRPDLRGPDHEGIVLSRLLGKMTRLVSIAQWWPDYVFAMSDIQLFRRGVVANLGWWHEAFSVEWQLPNWPPLPTAGMMWMTRNEMLTWAADGFRPRAVA